MLTNRSTWNKAQMELELDAVMVHTNNYIYKYNWTICPYVITYTHMYYIQYVLGVGIDLPTYIYEFYNLYTIYPINIQPWWHACPTSSHEGSPKSHSYVHYKCCCNLEYPWRHWEAIGMSDAGAPRAPPPIWNSWIKAILRLKAFGEFLIQKKTLRHHTGWRFYLISRMGKFESFWKKILYSVTC